MISESLDLEMASCTCVTFSLVVLVCDPMPSHREIRNDFRPFLLSFANMAQEVL